MQVVQRQRSAVQQMSALSSEEVNYLVYRYLLENGFVHSAFAFGHESLVAKSSIQSAEVPPAALISFIQKGLQYTEIESHLNDDGTETMCDETFSVLTPHACRVRSKKRLYDPYEAMDSDFGAAEIALEQATLLRGHSDMITVCFFNPISGILATGSADGSVRLWDTSKLDAAAAAAANANGAPALNPLNAATPRDKLLAESAVVLKVNKHEQKLAAAAAPPAAAAAAAAAAGAADEKAKGEVKARDPKAFVTPSTNCVVAMAWHPHGTQLASASYDGRIHIWSVQGGAGVPANAAAAAAAAAPDATAPVVNAELLKTVHAHKGPVSSLRYSPKGDALLSTGLDQSVVVTDATSGAVKHTFNLHTGAAMDGDWKSETMFASCSTDKSVLVCSVTNSQAAVKQFVHHSEVNALRWDPTATLLASASDDGTVRVWSLDSDHPLHDLRDHERPVGAIAWAFAPASVAAKVSAAAAAAAADPTTPLSQRPLMLATGSQDSTVRVYVLESAAAAPSADKPVLAFVLQKHAHPVTALSFSAGNAEYLATGSHDRLHVWSLKDSVKEVGAGAGTKADAAPSAALVRTFKSEGGINDLTWSADGRRIAACYSDHTGYVLQL